MFSLQIGKSLVLASKFFASADKDSVLAAITDGTKRVVFIDTPSTPNLVETIEVLLARGAEVIVRDHHDVPNPRNPREQEIANAANKVRELVGSNAVISNRNANPACSGLIEAGEFAGEGTVIVADPDPDGLTAAMKAVGVVYDGIDADAAVLDGARSEQTADRLTPVALLLVKGMATLPPFNPERPQIAEEAKGKLFAEFAAAATGDASALESLGRKVEAYEAGVREAEALAATATQPVAGVVMVDAVGKPRHDLTTLTQKLESIAGAKVTVVRKDNGPIAPKHGGVQVSLAVIKAFQAEVNLQELLTTGFTSSPESGIISNTTFLLHVSQEVWDSQVLPRLRTKFEGLPPHPDA
jgi:hypothetical protein